MEIRIHDLEMRVAALERDSGVTAVANKESAQAYEEKLAALAGRLDALQAAYDERLQALETHVAEIAAQSVNKIL